MVNPAEYVSRDAFQKNNIEKLTEEYADELMTMSGMCMDIGCGPGDITKNILLPALSANATMIGTDISVDLINYANQIYADKKRLTFEVLDIETKSLPEKYVSQFRHIFSFHVLQWCDVRRSFENIYKMLQNGGSVLTYFTGYSDIAKVFEILSEKACYAAYKEDIIKLISAFHTSTRPRKDLKDLLKSVGFEVDHCSNREVMNIRTLNITLSAILAVIPFWNKLPQNVAEEFRADCKREYMKLGLLSKKLYDGQEQTVAIHAFHMLVVYAKKPIM